MVVNKSFVKIVTDFGPLLVFFFFYYNSDKDLKIAIPPFIIATLVALIVVWFLEKKFPMIPLISGILISLFGGLTIWLNNPIFIKMKPTLIYLIFSSVLGYGLLKKKSYLKILMGSSIPMSDEGWLLLSKRFVGFFILLALINEIIWRFFSQDFWVNFKTFGLPILLILFMALQFNLFNKYSNKLKMLILSLNCKKYLVNITFQKLLQLFFPFSFLLSL